MQTKEGRIAVQISADASEYAAKLGWSEYVTRMVEAACGMFPQAGSVCVDVEDDPEIPDLRFVVFEARVRGLSVDEMVQAYGRWSDEIHNRLPYPDHYHFILSLRSIE